MAPPSDLLTRPGILYLTGYSSDAQLRYMTEADFARFRQRTAVPCTQEELEDDGGASEGHSRVSCWALIDVDGDHLQFPFGESYNWDQLNIEAYHFERQRGSQTETFKAREESTFDFCIVLLGYTRTLPDFRYRFLMKVPDSGDGQTETFERLDVFSSRRTRNYGQTEVEVVEELLAKLTGKHSNSSPGSPWIEMSTRVA